MKNFDGEKLLVPAVHPNMDMTVLRLLGTILSHGFMVCVLLDLPFLSLPLHCLGLKQNFQTA